MFEIIMLFALLYAAASQLFPKGPASTKAAANKKNRPNDDGQPIERRPAHSCRAPLRSLSHTHGRGHCHAKVA